MEVLQSQQLIKKTYFPNAEKTYTRKFSEIILAIQADKALSKIYALYLNKIYFGRSTRSNWYFFCFSLLF